MRAVMLVGGFGTRLRPLTLDVPKQMLPVVGVTMFERVVSALAAHGVTEVVVSLGYRPDAFTEAFPHRQCAGVALTYAVEPAPLDTAGAIRFAATHANITDTFLAINGDVLCDVNYSRLIDLHRSRRALGSLHLIGVDDPSRFGVVPTDASGRVTEFIEKPAAGTAPTNMINAGAYVLEPEVLDLIEPDVPVSIERVTFPELARRGQLYAEGTHDYWIDAGTPGAYLEANLDYLTGRRTQVLAGVLPGSKVHPEAVIVDSVIEPGASIGAGARVTRSVIMSGAQVGVQATVVESIVAGDAVIGTGAAVTDMSVVGFGQRVGDGAKLSAAVLPERVSWPT